MVFQTLFSNPRNFYFRWGAINCAIAVATGAFGAHGLKNFEPRRIEQWKTGAQYHFLHGLGLMAISQMGRNHHIVGSLLSTGIVLFSGSLYALVLTDQPKLGAITPIGGVAFIAGWLAMALAGL